MASYSILEPYIQSGGRHIKTDIEPYTIGGDKERLCVFCDKPHDSNRVLILNGEPHKSLDTGAFACQPCEVEIEEMVETIYGIEKQTFEKVTEKRKAREDIDDDEVEELKDDFDYFSQSFREEDSSADNRRYLSLSTLNDYYVFPDDIYKYYTHLNSKVDTYAILNTCPMCQVYMDENIKKLSMAFDVPVYPSDTLTGGKVIICYNCLKSLPDVFGRIASLRRNQKLFEVKCMRSEKKYLIDSDEHIQREQYSVPKGEMPPEYLGPEEAYKEVLERRGKAKTSQPLERYERITGICRCRYSVDLTINPAYTSFFHNFIKGDEHYKVCDRCRPHRDRLENINNTILELPNGGLLLLEPGEVDDGYVFRLDRGVLLELFTAEGEGLEFIAAAIEKYVQNNNTDI